MPDQEIKKGSEVVNEFIQFIEQNEEVDEKTFSAIKELHEENKLTKNRLLDSLRKQREEEKS